MPAIFKMSEDKKTDDTPTIVFAETSAVAPRRKTKKYVIIAVSGILAAAIILTAILVGMYIFTQAQKEIIQFTMQLGDRSKQDVTSDANENVVQYHVSNPSHDAWIVNDFNKDIQLVKVVTDGKTNCFLSALNRTNAVDPSTINGPDTAELTDAISLMYRVSDTPIADTSFLGKTARETCKGISVYWLYPYCSDENVDTDSDGTSEDPEFSDDDHPIVKRQATTDNSPYYCLNYMSYQSIYQVPCYTGCCKKVCACNVSFFYTVSNGKVQCSWTINSCPPTITQNPVLYDASCSGPRGMTCPNANHGCGCP